MEIQAEELEQKRNAWIAFREMMDRFFNYDPNPPVVIEKSGGRIIVHDGLSPEANAMAMAMYSRSPKSFLVHLAEVLKKGFKMFMSTFFVGYGHKSIGDCGSTNVCAEGVSMLAAKAIQNFQLYKGQEASTRYMDMNVTGVLNPLGTEVGQRIQDRSMEFYNNLLFKLTNHLSEKYPMEEGENEKEYEKAIKAKAFDISRGFLPAGCRTYVGWHATLREAWDHTYRMRFHPLAEVRENAETMLEALREKYPSSFGYKQYDAQDEFMRECAEVVYEDDEIASPFEAESHLEMKRLLRNKTVMRLLGSRPKKTELPGTFGRFGYFRFRFLLDFGSFRDMRRQRSCVQTMPLLTMRHGFHPWYLEQLPDWLKAKAVEHIQWQTEEIAKIEDPLLRQYYIPMGFRVACEMTPGLPSAVYIAELRADQSVHPTLRSVSQMMGTAIQGFVPGITLHCDMDPDKWSTRRGKHDIVRKD